MMSASDYLDFATTLLDRADKNGDKEMIGQAQVVALQGVAAAILQLAEAVATQRP
jgi:hypothetical protein